ncbi:hypothetical protein [Hymenobacter convexus]|uniref:hypothetical protein n=1 Tax=Hymenobacter sp. CA1UV-4 TaxID=3063782 RepID=UPI00271381CD|nr:hypothetical protein [Hymenobacter sp. CA1UV-4]MDO7853263.1 hypothetical protein [Hymenobacter sp. CA1UV-4]
MSATQSPKTGGPAAAQAMHQHPQAPKTGGAGRLLLKVLLLGSPFLAILITYFVFDPFRVLYHYQRFEGPLVAIANRDYISTQTYLNTYERRPYSSFILGNSRTMGYLTRDWAKLTGDSLSFHYDASSESLYGIWQKLLFLEQHHAALKNVLIICDHELLKKVDDYDSHLLRKDPRTTGASTFAFQLSFVKAYFSNTFFYQYLYQRATGKFTPELEEILEGRRVAYDPTTNDLTLPDVEQEIKRDSLGFYTKNDRLKRARKPSVFKAVIGAEQLRQLVAIRNVFARHNTNFQFVVSPLYYQQHLNPADISILQRTFGASHIHDFSGTNEFTSQNGNYYEDSHYRPKVGREILRRIYSAPSDSASIRP